ncbi:MAG: DUF1622 domain-containing protein [Leptolyngbyaceae cyanobacterium]
METLEILEGLELILVLCVSFAKLVLEVISVFCVVLGVFKTGQFVTTLNRQHRRGEEFPFNLIRLKFGTWLALALEFQLGADILATTVAPTTQDLARLAIVAIVRTFLNYFLEKEPEAERELEARQRTAAIAQPPRLE